MDEAEVRARIRERLKSGALPRMLPPMPMLEPGPLPFNVVRVPSAVPRRA